MMTRRKERILPGAQTKGSDTLDVRIKLDRRGLIDRAAAVMGKTRADFVLDAARRAAEEALLDRAVYVVSPAAYANFLARLDEAPKPNDRLRRTMQAVPYED